MEGIPAVRLERRKAWYQADVRAEPAWPLAAARPVPLYLSVPFMKLTLERQKAAAVTSYDSTAKEGRASFSHTFDLDTELTGSMRLKLWVSTPDAEDLDLFITVSKIDKAGREIHFSGYNGYARDCAAKGWLRASHRELDPALSTPLRPWHTHRREEPITPGEIAPVEIEILPSSTLFEAGTTLRLDIQGHDAAHYPAFAHKRTVNRGRHRVHCGGEFDSQLIVPWLIPS
jgi:predicted acyl esterase